jgi:hypothetical protein
MKDVNVNKKQWIGLWNPPLKINDELHPCYFSFLDTLKSVLPIWTSNEYTKDVRIIRVNDHKIVTHTLSVKEARRLLKIHEL